jgi:integrase/recombinase XerD
MNTLLNNPAEFTALIQRFFLERLMHQRNASPRTIEAYRDTFRLLFGYAKDYLHKAPTQLTLNDFNANLILGFLDHLESARINCIRSRNARLAAVHSFCRYLALQNPPALYLAQQILAIPSKRFEKPQLGFLSKEEIRIILATPNPDTWFGQRDRILLQVLYNTGARVSEMIGIRVSDVKITSGTSCICLHGKGRKQRTVPLWRETATQIRQWLKHQCLRDDQPLIPNRHGNPMTRANMAERIALAVCSAECQCPQLHGRHITPHSFRHTVALHLLQSGVDITVIALWLGHESTITTHGYIELDMEMKERALNTLNPPSIKKNRYQPSDTLLKFLNGL